MTGMLVGCSFGKFRMIMDCNANFGLARVSWRSENS
jgi:hypothetical protein